MNPWDLFEQMQRVFNQPFAGRLLGSDEAGTGFADWHPALDVRDDSEGYVVTADIPGVAPSDIEVTMHDGLLTIKGERQQEAEKAHGGSIRVERSYGSFYRQLRLPGTVDADRIEATSNNGVLTLTIPKAKEALPHKIEVH